MARCGVVLALVALLAVAVAVEARDLKAELIIGNCRNYGESLNASCVRSDQGRTQQQQQEIGRGDLQ